MSSLMPTMMSSRREEKLDRQIDRMLDEALRAFGTSADNGVPACNVWDDENGFYVQAALPGWEAGQIALEVNNQILTIKGERKEDSAESTRYHLREFGATRFVRLFKLPSFIDHDKASATHQHGLLSVVFPKREEAKCRRIVIAAE
jgi:HSP20 family protein